MIFPPRPRVIQVIESEVKRGCGLDATNCPQNHVHEPMHLVVQYHTLDGGFLAERDDWAEEQRLVAKREKA